MTKKQQRPFQAYRPGPPGRSEAPLAAELFPAQTRAPFIVSKAIALLFAFTTFGFGSKPADGSEPGPATVPASGSFGHSQAKQMVQLTQLRDGKVIHFLAENLESADVTATFDLGLVNLRSSTAFPFTTTLTPHQKVEAFSLTLIDEAREWHFDLTNAYTLGSSRAVHDDSYVYSLPYTPGQVFRVSQADDGTFSHSGPERHAIDWKMPERTPVLAARSGVVVGVKDDSDAGGPDRSFENSANYILIQHRDGTIGNYAHLLQHGVRVRLGQAVETGTVIGLSGNTGFSSGPHLHFSVFKTRDGRERESIPIRFRTEKGAETLVSGKGYAAPRLQLTAKKAKDLGGKGSE